MIKEFYKNKKFEELLGLTGLLYITLLFFICAILVQFLVRITISSLVPDSIAGSTIPQFEVDIAQKL